MNDLSRERASEVRGAARAGAGAAGTAWHALRPADVLAQLSSRTEGLTDDEAAARLHEVGPNELPQARSEPALRVLLRQFQSSIVYLLLGSTALALALGKVKDGVVVLAAVLVNAVIGFLQEFRAGRAIEALSRMVPHDSTVLRSGAQVSVPARELVPGDVVMLAAGDRVPADARLLAVRQLRVDEAALTGESVPVEKDAEPVEEEAEPADRASLVFGGTLVSAGTGAAVVVATGAATELGRISRMLHETTELQTPLTRALTRVASQLTFAVLGVAAVLFAVSLVRGYELPDALLVAVALAVAAIPEGLPAIITIALAIGVQRLARRRAIVRKLPSVETLGSTTVICTDKTGTLTRNEMTVQALWTAEGEYALGGIGYAPEGALSRDGGDVEGVPDHVRELVVAGALCSDASLRLEEGAWRITGDPTEAAFVVAARKLGVDVDEERRREARLDEIPFDSANKYMATLHRRADGSARLIVKGAAEVVARRCDLPDGLDEDGLHAIVERLARRGLRVLALADARVGAEQRTIEPAGLESGLRLLGLLAMIDPPRPEAVEAVKACHRAGITVKMITGDHPVTAEAIGERLGLLEPGSKGLPGAALAKLSDDEVRAATRGTNVFARVAPEHKLRLVRALQAEGHVVAMTGDGVNDAPALKQANIGIAMGITGTAVAKESADVVLADDNFATIAAAVREGRRIYDNLVKSLAFVLPTNLGLGLILVVSVAFLPVLTIGGHHVPLMPMLPAQMLWVNLISAVTLSLPLAFETAEPDVMERAPRRPGAPILSPFVLGRTVLTGLVLCAGAVGMFLWEYYREVDRTGHDIALREARTMAITTVVAFQAYYLLNSRSLRGSALRLGLFSNPSVFVGIGVLVLLHAAFIYLPWLQAVFGTAPLDAAAIGLSAAVGAVILPIIAAEKALRERARRRRARA